MHKLLYTNEAKKNIAKLDGRMKLKVKEALENIAKDPSTGKPLTRELKGRWSYRVGDYRIIYRIYDREVVVLVDKLVILSL